MISQGAGVRGLFKVSSRVRGSNESAYSPAIRQCTRVFSSSSLPQRYLSIQSSSYFLHSFLSSRGCNNAHLCFAPKRGFCGSCSSSTATTAASTTTATTTVSPSPTISSNAYLTMTDAASPENSSLSSPASPLPLPLPLPQETFPIISEKWHVSVPLTARLFQCFRLNAFSDLELRGVFTFLDKDQDGVVQEEDVRSAIFGIIKNLDYSESERQSFADFAIACVGKGGVSFEVFRANLRKTAAQVDKRAYPIGVAMAITGTTVGIMMPAMPLLTQTLGISTTEFGIILGAFALSRLLGNLPTAILVEQVGRKRLMTYAPWLLALGMGGCGFATCFEHLVACRLVTGLGVAAFATGATMMAADIGNAVNRTRTIAPVSAGFAIGSAIGPAIGGLLAGHLGLGPTFMVAGGFFIGLSILNHFILSETRPVLSALNKNLSIRARTIGQWPKLWRNPDLRHLVVLNGLYFAAFSGAQMCLLPLFLVGDWEMSVSTLGGVFAGMAIVNVVSNHGLAKLADTYGKRSGIALAGSLVGVSFILIPLMPTLGWLALPLMSMALGSTLLGTAPFALAADLSTPTTRAQALALLRMVGDLGFLVGSASAGYLADIYGIGIGMQACGGLLLLSCSWFFAMAMRMRALRAKLK